MSSRRVVIVGAGLAGLRTAQALRRNDFDGSVTLIGQERHPPYERPPLSKGVLTGATDPETLVYADPATLEDQGIALQLDVAATALDVHGQTVSLSDGGKVGYDQLVVATGSTARQPFTGPPAGVLTLRTLDDALSIRRALTAARRLVIIGAGFIGLEIASAARTLGVQVTVVEAAGQPLGRSLGPGPAEAVASLALRAGVSILCNQQVAGFVGEPHLTGVALQDGSVLDADLAVVGVGAIPNTAWLNGSGLPADTAGVVCTPTGRVAAQRNLWAVGDVAAWTDSSGNPRRHEHWTAAVEQANVVGANVVDDGVRTVAAAAYVWSEQFGVKVNLVGDTVDHDQVRLLDTTAESLLALYGRGGRLTGACVVGQMPLVLKCRRWVAAHTPLAELDLWQSAA
jgi:3-phenylpropionate/trans-cinnamate dioxygenase ferredoxin reductase subunit